EILDDDVAFRGELPQQIPSALGGKIERDALLVASLREPHERVAAFGVGAKTAQRVACLRRLELDHLGAGLAPDRGTVRPGDESAEIEDADSVQCGHILAPRLAARSSSLLATLMCMRSIISPFLSLTAPRPSRAAASMASSTSFAQAICAAEGVITSWIISICEGWIAILHSKPSSRARFAAAR